MGVNLYYESMEVDVYRNVVDYYKGLSFELFCTEMLQMVTRVFCKKYTVSLSERIVSNFVLE